MPRGSISPQQQHIVNMLMRTQRRESTVEPPPEAAVEGHANRWARGDAAVRGRVIEPAPVEEWMPYRDADDEIHEAKTQESRKLGDYLADAFSRQEMSWSEIFDLQEQYENWLKKRKSEDV